MLVADAHDPGAFDHLPKQYLKVIGLMAGAQMHTADLLSLLKKKQNAKVR